MYLSKLTLDPQHPQARRDLSSRYEMHRTLVRAFAPDAQTPPAPFLWRLEPSRVMGSDAVLLVQSETRADWSVLDAFTGYALEIQGNKSVNLERLIANAGEQFRFRLVANPTLTLNGKRYGLVKEDEQLDWLARQGAKHGFGLCACLRLGNERIQVRQGSTGHRITLQSVLFEGALEVQDTTNLRIVVRQGLGHGKALGLGLVSLGRLA